MTRTFYQEPPTDYGPGGSTLHALTVYATDNAYLRLRLEDAALMDREWHRCDHAWIPLVPSMVEENSADLHTPTDAARLSKRDRTQIYAWIRAGRLRSYRVPGSRVSKVSLSEVCALSAQRPRMDT